MALTRLKALCELPEDGRVFVYGTGEMGRTMVLLLARYGRPATGYIDSARAGECGGMMVTPVAEFRATRRPDDIVLVCSSFVGEIVRHLEPCISGRDFVAAAFLDSAVFERKRFGSYVEDGRIHLVQRNFDGQ